MTSARAIMCTRFLSSAYRVVDRRDAGEPVGEHLLGDGVDQPGAVASIGWLLIRSAT